MRDSVTDQKGGGKTTLVGQRGMLPRGDTGIQKKRRSAEGRCGRDREGEKIRFCNGGGGSGGEV